MCQLCATSTCAIFHPAVQVYGHNTALSRQERNETVLTRWRLVSKAAEIEQELPKLAGRVQKCRNNSKQTHQARLQQYVTVSASLEKHSQAVQSAKEQVEQLAEEAKVDGDKAGYELFCSVFTTLRAAHRKLVELADLHWQHQLKQQADSKRSTAGKQQRQQRKTAGLDSDILSILAPAEGAQEQDAQQQGQQEPQAPAIPDCFAQGGLAGCAPLTQQQQLLLGMGGSTAVSGDGSSTLRQLAAVAYRAAASQVFRLAGAISMKDAALRSGVQAHLAAALREPQNAGGADAAREQGPAQAAVSFSAAGAAGAEAGGLQEAGVGSVAAQAAAAPASSAAAAAGVGGVADQGDAGALANTAAWPPQLPTAPAALAALVADMLVQSYAACSAWQLQWSDVVTAEDPVVVAAQQQV